MSDDIPTIEIDMQKVADNWADAECVMRREWHKKHPRRMNSILQWSIENTIAPAVFRDKMIEMHDRTFMHVCPRGSYNEQQETPAEKRRREQAIQLIRQYEANRRRFQTKS